MVLRLTIDGRAVEVAGGATVLDAVNRLGLPLPQLCKDPDRPPLGACRTCLVQVEGQRGFPASCHLPARDGMVVRTDTPDVTRIRRAVLDLTLSMLTPGDGRDGFGQLREAGARHGLPSASHDPLHRSRVDDSKSFFVLDREACILCGRCTTACDDVQRIGAISLIGKGHAERVGVFGDGLMADSVCTSCGQCVATCPTGALRPKETPARVTRRVETTCPYCGVGCGIVASVREDRRLAVMTDDVPANGSSQGMLCVKGRFGTGFVHAKDRVLRPMVRRGAGWEPVCYAESFPRGKGKFVPVSQGPQAAELPDPDYPFILNTGRLLYHWHGGTITRRVEGLLQLAPHLQVSIHPADARRLRVKDGDPVRVLSRRGELEGLAWLTDAVRVGELFIPFVKLADSAANFLTNSAHDPDSKIPEYKVCAVRVERVASGVEAGLRAASPAPA